MFVLLVDWNSLGDVVRRFVSHVPQHKHSHKHNSQQWNVKQAKHRIDTVDMHHVNKEKDGGEDGKVECTQEVVGSVGEVGNDDDEEADAKEQSLAHDTLGIRKLSSGNTCGIAGEEKGKEHKDEHQSRVGKQRRNTGPCVHTIKLHSSNEVQDKGNDQGHDGVAPHELLSTTVKEITTTLRGRTRL